MKTLILSLFTIFSSLIGLSQATYLSTGEGTGHWNDPLSWTLAQDSPSDGNNDGIPDANDNVWILPGHYLIIDIEAVCKDLTISDHGQFTELMILAKQSLTVGGNMYALVQSDSGELLFSVYGTLNIKGNFYEQAGRSYNQDNEHLEWDLGYSGTVVMSGNKMQP